jgi:hypothetical protein
MSEISETSEASETS